MLWRMLHQQLWISLSRYRTAKGKNLIVDRSIDFEQVDRESKWDDQILLNGIIFYIAYWGLEAVQNMPLWRMDGLLQVFILHIGPIEFLYYWLHRALHHHFLYSRYHSHHHSSIVSQPHTGITLCITLVSGQIILFSCHFMIISMERWMNLTDIVYETSLKKLEDVPDVAHLTHLTTLQSVYHLRLGFASLASKPLNSKWYMWLIWPLTCLTAVITWAYGRTFIVERNTFKKLKAQLWVVPRFKNEYLLLTKREAINKSIEEAILEAEEKGIKGEYCNKNGEIFLERHPNFKVKVVDGSSLAVAVVLNSIPVGTSQVMFRGRLSKVTYSIVLALCHKGIQVTTIRKVEYEKLKKPLTTEDGSNLVFITNGFNQKVWLVGDDFTKDEQSMASKGTIFVFFSQFPPKKIKR
uniref:Very-long-chain aldehyde decarbonylase CER1-like C-terminal domain-containing protein n=1 Tax=Chenopodium quinoa TaxID=63459 RepID=A0A803L0F7_CHEQI